MQEMPWMVDTCIMFVVVTKSHGTERISMCVRVALIRALVGSFRERDSWNIMQVVTLQSRYPMQREEIYIQCDVGASVVSTTKSK